MTDLDSSPHHSHLVAEDVSVSPKMLLSEVVNLVGYPTSYSKVQWAKQKIIEFMYGTYKERRTTLCQECFTRLPKQRTYINKVESEDVDGGPNCFILDRMFWALAQSIEGFKFCHPVLTMDGTFLTGRYKGTILTSVAVDVNDQILPIAFAIIERNNTSS